jgi:hypothetical protein
MKKYLIKSTYFSVSRKGIHLMRNGFNYETIQYDSIKKVSIERKNEVYNWLASLVFGIFIFGLGMYLSYGFLKALTEGEFAGSYKSIFMLLTPIFGICFVYLALRRAPVITLSYGNGKFVRLPIRDIIKSGQYKSLLEVLSKSLGDRLEIKISI